ncbi:FAD-dependent oxidoreductase [Taibaiella helva]|uniref:FAD-dependent oxidoreductase n=1 Tax=Taibaiella helva TaxID=2301235 RepID=UPI000E573B48|nr:FAD-dependent oxidoreductase [Taibaiella helva]
MKNRDGFSTSLWQESLKTEAPATTPGSGPFDVIIIGAGITGMTTALLLLQSGKKCLILEAHNVGFGTTSGTTAHLNTVIDTPYADLISKFGKQNAILVARGAAEAIAIIKGHVDQYHIDCDFAYKDGYLFSQNERERKQLDKIQEGLEAVGIPAAQSATIPVPLPFDKAIRFGAQAQFHPVKYLSALLQQYIAAGGSIKEHTAAGSIKSEGAFQKVHAGQVEYRATDIIYATHIPPGINLLHFRCAPYRSYVLALELANDQYPDGLAYDLQEPYHYFRTATQAGKPLLLVGGNDHKTGHEPHADHVFSELEAYARKYYDVRAVAYRWSSQYYEPADGLPYIGHLPGGGEHQFVATGYSGNGMIFGTLAARILCDLIVSGDSPYAGLLSPSRIKPVAGFSRFVKENADVLKHFVADRIKQESLTELSALAKGEGRIVLYEEEKIALYKDEQGKLYALHPVCPHAGCIVQWNSAERSWDCPCHGARYTVTGEMLNGPASEGLRLIVLDE